MATMREEVYDKLNPLLEQMVDITCDRIEELEECEHSKLEYFNKLRVNHPDQILIVETPEGSVKLRIGDAMIYEGMNGEIVFDSE